MRLDRRTAIPSSESRVSKKRGFISERIDA